MHSHNPHSFWVWPRYVGTMHTDLGSGPGTAGDTQPPFIGFGRGPVTAGDTPGYIFLRLHYPPPPASHFLSVYFFSVSFCPCLPGPLGLDKLPPTSPPCPLTA